MTFGLDDVAFVLVFENRHGCWAVNSSEDNAYTALTRSQFNRIKTDNGELFCKQLRFALKGGCIDANSNPTTPVQAPTI